MKSNTDHTPVGWPGAWKLLKNLLVDGPSGGDKPRPYHDEMRQSRVGDGFTSSPITYLDHVR